MFDDFDLGYCPEELADIQCLIMREDLTPEEIETIKRELSTDYQARIIALDP